ncbi:MAG: hypothetical protein ACPGN3_12525 [Opitutales bacterium]
MDGRKLLGIGVLAIVLGLLVRVFFESDEGPQATEENLQKLSHTPVELAKTENVEDAVASDASVESLLDKLLNAENEKAVMDAVKTLRAYLNDNDDAAKVLSELWGSLDGADSLVADFTIDRSGNLQAGTSARAIVLNLLSEFYPAFALEEAQGLLSNSNDSELHSVAMQTVSRLSGRQPAVDADMYDAIVHHLTRVEWLSEPTAGYLHGFDLAVAHPSSNQAPILMNLESGAAEESVQYAARLVLDRWSQQDYVWTTEEMRNSDGFWEVDYRLRAQTFARANPASDAETASLISHLEDPRTSFEEAQRIISLYPLISNHVSYNLVTTSQAPNHNQAKETVANAAVWLSEYAGITARPELVDVLEDRADFLSQ